MAVGTGVSIGHFFRQKVDVCLTLTLHSSFALTDSLCISFTIIQPTNCAVLVWAMSMDVEHTCAQWRDKIALPTCVLQ